MNWDEVEREFVIMASDLRRLAKTFSCMALALRRERMECATQEGGNRDEPSEKTNKAGRVQPVLPFARMAERINDEIRSPQGTGSGADQDGEA